MKRRSDRLWNDLGISEFRAFVDRIDNLDVAKALFDDIRLASQTVADDLLCEPDTDALRHPHTPDWRKRATAAKVYIDRKRAIAVARIVVLGGIVSDDVLKEIRQSANVERRTRGEHGPQGVLDFVRAIVADLAASDPVLISDDEQAECVLCASPIREGDPLSDHAEDCPWRRAVEDIERFPIRTIPAEEGKWSKRKAEAKEAKEQSAKNVRQTLEAALKKQHEKHIAHAERMEEEKRKLRRALRAAIRGIMGGDMASAIAAVSEIDSGYLTPEFYMLEPKSETEEARATQVPDKFKEHCLRIAKVVRKMTGA